jgi:hypothetical protein
VTEGQEGGKLSYDVLHSDWTYSHRLNASIPDNAQPNYEKNPTSQPEYCRKRRLINFGRQCPIQTRRWLELNSKKSVLENCDYFYVDHR